MSDVIILNTYYHYNTPLIILAALLACIFLFAGYVALMAYRDGDKTWGIAAVVVAAACVFGIFFSSNQILKNRTRVFELYVPPAIQYKTVFDEYEVLDVDGNIWKVAEKG